MDPWLSKDLITVHPNNFPQYRLSTMEYQFGDHKWFYSSMDPITKIGIVKRTADSSVGLKYQDLWYARKDSSNKYYLNHYKYSLFNLSYTGSTVLVKYNNGPTFSFSNSDGKGILIKTVTDSTLTGLYLKVNPETLNVYLNSKLDSNCYWNFKELSDKDKDFFKTRFERWTGILPFPNPSGNSILGNEKSTITVLSSGKLLRINSTSPIILDSSNSTNSNTMGIRIGGITNRPSSTKNITSGDEIIGILHINAIWKPKVESENGNKRYIKNPESNVSSGDKVKQDNTDGSLDLYDKTPHFLFASIYNPNSFTIFAPANSGGGYYFLKESGNELIWESSNNVASKMKDNNDEDLCPKAGIIAYFRINIK